MIPLTNYFKRIGTTTAVASDSVDSTASTCPVLAGNETIAGTNLKSFDNQSTASKPLSTPVSDLGTDVPSQPSGPFPLRRFGKKDRCFSDKWYLGRSWLEYSVRQDAAFCFCCRQFSKTLSSTGEYAFKRGFRNWKVALEKGRGFSQHEVSADHIASMAAWADLQNRKASNTEICSLVNENQLNNNKYYVSSVLDVIKFLAENELPLRGDKEADNDNSTGLFRKLFEYTLIKDKKLADIMKSIPQIAKYTSPDIQNEIISILAKTVQEEISKKVKRADIPYYTIKIDGTKDSVGTENIAIVLRAVLDGKVFEHLYAISTTIELDANAIASVIFDTLDSAGLDPKCILSQCYDGASVMSGIHGGVQKILKERLNKDIPYIHCFNHQLHLVVTHAISEHCKVGEYFEVCSTLYNFTRKHSVAKLYEGEKLKRLLPQRWTGHLLTTSAVLSNYEQIVNLLKKCSNCKKSADIAIEATGILSYIVTLEFRFITKLVHTILSILDPLNKALQSESMDLLTAYDLVKSTLEVVREQRTSNHCENLCASKFVVQSGCLLEDESPPSKRRTLPSSRLQGSIITDFIPSRSNPPKKCEMQQLYNCVFDRTIVEIERRFSASNVELLKSMTALTSFDSRFLEVKELKTLASLCEVNLTNLSAEINTAREFLHRKLKEGNIVSKSLPEIVLFMHTYRDAFPSVYRLFSSALTVGASSSSCEAAFSTLSRVLTPYRRSMLQPRKANLILLSHESKIMKTIDNEKLLRKFNDEKNRRLQLY